MRSRSGSRIPGRASDLLERDIDSSTSYRFNNGVPNQITERASPVSRYDDLKAELGMFVQDKWTLNKLTLTRRSPVRLLQHVLPGQPLGPGPLVPTRNFTVPEYKWDNWKDISPRVGGGVRPVRQRQDRRQGEPRPVRARGRSDRRQRVLDPREHRDAIVGRPAGRGVNGDYMPQCDLLNPNANGECGAISDFAVRHAGRRARRTTRRPERLGQARLQLGVLGRRPA